MRPVYIPVDEMASQLKALPSYGWPGEGVRSTWWSTDHQPVIHTLETLEPLLNRMGYRIRPVVPADNCPRPTATIALEKNGSRSGLLCISGIDEITVGWARTWAGRLWAFEMLLRLRSLLPLLATQDLDNTRLWLVRNAKGIPPSGVPAFLVDWPGETFGYPECQNYQDGHLTREGWWAAAGLDAVRVDGLDTRDWREEDPWEIPAVMLLGEVEAECRRRLNQLPGAWGRQVSKARL
jgi:hypothetical protein